MKKERIKKMVVVTISLMAVLALIPVQTAFGGVVVKSITVTLPSDGQDVAVTLKGTKKFLLWEILADTNPTLDDGLCNPMGTQCFDCDFRIVSLKIGGSEVMPGIKDEDNMGKNDHIALRPVVAKAFTDALIPVKANQKVVLTLDTDNGNNPVKVKLTFGIEGGGTVKLSK